MSDETPGSSPKIEVYMTRTCPYCAATRGLLDRKGVAYEMIDVGADPELRDAMTKRAGGRRTVPQTFIDGRHIGGNDALQKLNEQGKLDALLGL